MIAVSLEMSDEPQKRVMQNIEIGLITRKFIDFNENECF